MPKVKISEYSATANSNTDVASINIDEGCAPSGINNAIRAIMGHLKDFQSGTNGDPFNGPVNGTVGATTPSTGAFTTLTTTGNVGLGTSSPAARLSVIAASANSTAATIGGIEYGGSKRGLTIKTFNSAGGDDCGVEFNAANGLAGYGAFKFAANTTTLATIDASGNLGIGTSSPTRKLTIVGDTTNYGILTSNPSGYGGINLRSNTITSQVWSFIVQDNGANSDLLLYGGASAGTKLTIDSSGNLGLGVTPSAWTNYTGSQVGALGGLNLGGSVDDSFVGSNVYYNVGYKFARPTTATYATMYRQTGGVHSWQTSTATGTAGNAITFTQAMTLDSSGNLLVNTTSAVTTTVGSRLMYGATDPYISSTLTSSSNATTSYLLYSTGAAAYRFYVGMGGTVYATNTTISAISDQRLKENIRDLDDGLASVMALKPRKFDWKEGKGANIKDARGFIAQEFETVFPDMIDEWKDPAPEGEEPYKAINANLIPTLVKAMQEQQAIIQSLTARITALEGA